MLPEPEVCRRARLSRDPRFDGRFYVGVLTTGIYCRPVCPARTPAEENVRYFASSAAAQDAGFRPCLRCRPEAARRLPEWTLASQTVVRGMRLIDAGYLDEHRVEALASRLAMSTRHLNRLFLSELGATPKSLARARRVQLAKRLIDGSPLRLADVAMRAGFGSVRRFNDELKATYGRSPRALRRDGRSTEGGSVALQLPVRLPYHADWVFSFLEHRALPGLEAVAGHEYRRALFRDGNPAGWLTVRWKESALEIKAPADSLDNLGNVLARVRRMFDLDADPCAVEAVLGEDRLFTAPLRRDPGLRVPGAWDGFEIAVRAVLGQQVSVARARDLAVALCARFGGGDFPGPAALADADVSAIGMPGKRGEAVRAIARAVLDGRLDLDEGAEPDELTESLTALPGIGPWTAGYIGMRVARNPDAFPEADWVVLKVLNETAARARRRAEAWRPWRAYGVMVLWRMAAHARAAPPTTAAAAAGGR
jgi:AraC family transcriptional regulator of adaptative response / DNA-3-methyladenine glycosylase II